MPKIDLYPDSKLPCLSAHLSKENRPFHRPIGSAIGTGGLDFLIAHALLILCHSLFKVVIRKFLKTQEKIKTSVIRSFYFIALITLAGVPATTIFSGTSLVTTAPAKADILSAVCIKRREQADGLIHFLSRKLRQDFPYFLRSVVRIV